MDIDLHQLDVRFLRDAIELAGDAERRGNLPVGAVIVLGGEVVAIGKSRIWKPTTALTRHAEMEALRAAPAQVWDRSREVTLYTTLEPCLMCAGAILLHHIGRLVFGSRDPYGGIGVSLGSLPPYFREQIALIRWEGPALPEECDPLYRRLVALEGIQNPDATFRASDS